MKNWINGAKDKKFVTSFSGGKDSMLALYYAMEQGESVGLIVMMEEDGEKSRAHNISPEILEAQAKSIGVEIFKGAASWKSYRSVLIENLEKAKERGAQVLVTGDIDMPEHQSWYEEVANEVGLGLAMPLWKKGHREAVEEFISLGFIAKVVTVNLDMRMRKEDLGRVLTLNYLNELEERGIDPCGESGEFHTSVIDGPIFSRKLEVEEEKIILNEKYQYLILKLKN
ncbi:MAG: diphthine--ammonia ligase [Sarcina sp.]